MELKGLLALLLRVPKAAVSVKLRDDDGGAGFAVEAGLHRFIVEWKGAGAAASVAAGVDEVVKLTGRHGRRAIPLLVVPYMSETGRQRCAAAGISWVDLSGNADVSGPGLRIHVEGRWNQFKSPGRPASAFAPKSARVTRCLMMNPREPVSQKDLVKSTGLGKSFVSRIVRSLEGAGLIVRSAGGSIKIPDPGLLLGAWDDEYRFEKHEIIKGHVSARSSEGVLRALSESLRKAKMEHAATGLGAAWALDHFAGFNTVTFFLSERPAPRIMDVLGFNAEPRGANVWLVLPNDPGVFHGARDQDGVRCAHPVQVYLDLKGHSERAKEARERLRERHLNWGRGGR